MKISRWLMDAEHLADRWKARERHADRIERILQGYDCCCEPEPETRKASVRWSFLPAAYRGTAS